MWLGSRGWLATLFTVLAFGGCKGNTTAPAPEPPKVTVAVATERPVPIQIDVIGNAQAYRIVQLKPQVSGQIDRVLLQQGQHVRAGQLLFGLDPRPFQAVLDQAKAKLQEDLATMRYNEVQAKRYALLQKEGVVPLEQAQGTTATAKASAATVQADQAAVESAQVNLTYTNILAPISAQAGAILVNLGNVVQANTTTLTILNQITPIYVQFNIPEQHLGRVRAGGVGKLKVFAHAPTETQYQEGILTFINNTVDPSTGTVQLMGTFGNGNRRLWPGEFLSVHLLFGVNEHAIVIPAAAVQAGQQGKYVYVVQANGTAVSRAIQTSQTYHQMAVVASGVNPGERVVVQGQIGVAPGQQVQIIQTVPVGENEEPARGYP